MLSRWPWFTEYTGGRKQEWTTSICTLGWGLFLGLPFNGMETPRAMEAAGRVLPEYVWSWVFGLIGGGLVYVLHIDQHRGWPCYARAGMFMSGMVAYLVLGTAFLRVSPNLPGTYFTFSMGLLFCGSGLISACRDVGREIAKRRGSD